VKDLRTHLLQAQKTIMATAILHNMATDWGKVDVDAAEDEAGSEEEEEEEDAAQVIGRERERAQGSMVREAMLQARFLSINSLAISFITTPQLYFYFNLKKIF